MLNTFKVKVHIIYVHLIGRDHADKHVIKYIKYIYRNK